MKIHELRFKNLNSLYGEWYIDFTDPEYVSNGIFSLVGPTGAGKSTLLDAVCLALYGATPRLGKITKSGNEIMSRQTGECFSEVTFESRSGLFRCHWSQHRARKKADGNLIDARHEISDGLTGKPIETKKSLVPGVIEEKSGMDFDRFTRAMLLAQGGFDTFLKADVEEKSKILEQITGTTIYSEISRRVHARQRDEREKLNLLMAEVAGITLLTKEEEQTICEALETGKETESRLSAQIKDADNGLLWLTAIDDLNREMTRLKQEAEELHGASDAFSTDRKRLDLALKAASLDGAFAALMMTKEAQEDDRAAFKKIEEKLPGLTHGVRQGEASLERAEANTAKAKEALHTAMPLLEKVGLLDQRLADQKKEMDRLDALFRQEKTALSMENRRRQDIRKERGRSLEALGLAQAYLDKNGCDEWLVSGLAGAEEQLNTLVFKKAEIHRKKEKEKAAKAALEESERRLEDCTQKHHAAQQTLKEAGKKREEAVADLATLLGERLLREYRSERDGLYREMAFHAKIAELQAHRARLEDGKPCPLCGATIHPFAQGNIPAPDETEHRIETLSLIIHKAEHQESIIGDLDILEKKARQDLAAGDMAVANVTYEKNMAEEGVARMKEELSHAAARMADLEQILAEKLLPLGMDRVSLGDPETLAHTLKKRLDRWQAQATKKKEIDLHCADLEKELARIDAVIEMRKRSCTEKQAVLEEMKTACDAGYADRKEMFGTRSVSRERTRLNDAVAHAEAEEKEAVKARDDARGKLNNAETTLGALKERITEQKRKLDHLEHTFSGMVTRAGFTDQDQFVQARLTVEEREALMARAKDLDDRAADLAARRKDRENRLAAEMARKLTDDTMEALTSKLKILEEKKGTLQDEMSALKHKILEHGAAQRRVREKQAHIHDQKSVCGCWDTLHMMIGSADGKKYRNFAQGVTFERLVSHANQQLGKMTDRYLLIRDDAHPLLLNVIDSYQAGEIRSTQNLSGGESFIVSLALALGLSRMAGRKVRVDSLFLDEGFGSLDEETLETALETLAGLPREGKLIGVISHVPALQERIRTQITVTPVSSGRSVITGPGCRRGNID